MLPVVAPPTFPDAFSNTRRVDSTCVILSDGDDLDTDAADTGKGVDGEMVSFFAPPQSLHPLFIPGVDRKFALALPSLLGTPILVIRSEKRGSTRARVG